MVHTTKFDKTNLVGLYGNFENTSGSSYPNFYSAQKDIEERFLDEYYRYTSYFSPGAVSVALDGPGLSGWTGGAIDLPVRATDDVSWASYHWVEQGGAVVPLNATVFDMGLQVAGLPDRNPPLSDNVVSPYPSCGVLIYPQKDYTLSNIRPNVAEDGIPTAQPDYSALLAAGGLRWYIRAFDAGFTRTPFMSLNKQYETECIFRFNGITLKDFEYRAYGPGRTSSFGLAIMAKIPGFTTWMDMGRNNGSGPSKQSATLDGAGCRIMDSDTFDGVDAQTGMVYCQVKIDVGPYAYFFENSQGEYPILIKVLMYSGAYLYNLEAAYDTETELFGLPDPDVSSSLVRGLVGIKVVHPG
jgi:hypothetical protein